MSWNAIWKKLSGLSLCDLGKFLPKCLNEQFFSSTSSTALKGTTILKEEHYKRTHASIRRLAFLIASLSSFPSIKSSLFTGGIGFSASFATKFFSDFLNISCVVHEKMIGEIKLTRDRRQIPWCSQVAGRRLQYARSKTRYSLRVQRWTEIHKFCQQWKKRLYGEIASSFMYIC